MWEDRGTELVKALGEDNWPGCCVGALNTEKDGRKEDQLQRPQHPGAFQGHLQVKDLVAYVLNVLFSLSNEKSQNTVEV